MSLVCPQCNASVGEGLSHCPACGADLDALLTIGLPTPPRKASPVKAPRPAKPPARPPSPSRPTATEAPRARHDPGRSFAPAPVPPSPTPVAPAAPTYAPPSYGPAPVDAPPPSAPHSGGLRGWMIRMLGGQPASMAPQPASAPPAMPAYPPSPQPYLGQPPVAPWPPPPPAAAWPPQEPIRPPAPAPSQAAVASFEPPQADDGKTVYMGGIDLEKFRIPKYSYVLEILDKDGQWRVWEAIRPGGLNVGRKQNSAGFPALGSMAVRHVRIGYDKTQLVAEDLGALNGVFLKIDRPTELMDGARFRVGNQVLEFHRATGFHEVPAIKSNDGEEFWSYDLEPLGSVDLIRPNDEPGLRFPITKRDQTVIGREGPGVDIALVKDPLASAPHARIRFHDGIFYLEDMNSRNGTYLQLRGITPLKSGDVLLVGRVLLRVVEQAG